jgi:nitrous oxide reductase accessory protein NosL
MSLLQEMEKFGLADCAFNRKLIKGNKTMFTVIYKTYIGGVESYAYRRFTNRANATTFARKTGGTIEKA